MHLPDQAVTLRLVVSELSPCLPKWGAFYMWLMYKNLLEILELLMEKKINIHLKYNIERENINL